MKNLVYTAIIICAAVFGMACDPIIDSRGTGTSVTSADQIQASVTSVVVNGKQTNKVTLSCSSPVLCQWTDGVNTLSNNDTEMILLIQGKQTITLNALAADGTMFRKTFDVEVEDMYFPVPPEYGYFCGAGEKIWTWAETNCFGNGGSSDVGPAWWILQPADIADQCSGKNLPADGVGATMKFILNGKQMIKTSADGVVSEGKFDFDMSAGEAGWSIGTLTVTNTNILCGYDFNAEGFTPWNVYHIIRLDENTLVLGAQEHAPNSNYWYWVFKAL
jgi:hypothetical protein